MSDYCRGCGDEDERCSRGGCETCCFCGRSLPKPPTAEEDNKELRKLLWLRHGCDGLYGDDGEMQCNMGGCMIDFKRDSIETIKHRWRSYAQKLIEEAGGIEAIIGPILDQRAPMIDKTQDDR
jgi:hypothetical protein